MPLSSGGTSSGISNMRSPSVGTASAAHSGAPGDGGGVAPRGYAKPPSVHDGDMDTAITDHLLSTTRAVRRKLDLDRPVGNEVIVECIRLATQAPTASIIQYWRWVVVRDQYLKDELGKLFRKVGNAYMQRSVEALGEAVNEPAMARAVASGQCPTSSRLRATPSSRSPISTAGGGRSSNLRSAALRGPRLLGR